MEIRKLILWVVCIIVPVLLLVGMYKCSMGPTLYSGDVLEKRPCPYCKGGSGKSECEGCGFDGTLDLIQPGPNRPTHFIGEVFDEKIRYPHGKLTKWVAIPGKAGLTDRPPGFLAGASVHIKGADGSSWNLTTASNGVFSVTLPPGNYTVSASMTGYQPYQSDLEVKRITAPIWLDEPPVSRDMVLLDQPPRGHDQMTMMIGLEK